MIKNGHRLRNLTGKRFGKLIVLERVEKPKNVQHKGAFWLCKCDCGKTKSIAATNLTSNHIRSCGCLKKTLTPPSSKTHNMTNTKTYRLWNNMKQRCYNPKRPEYKNYGGRGIQVCEKWRLSFIEFHNYVSALPCYNKPGYTLDRIDNSSDYKPYNVRWATRKEQSQNQRPRTKRVR
jgi:hypothetical protein